MNILYVIKHKEDVDPFLLKIKNGPFYNGNIVCKIFDERGGVFFILDEDNNFINWCWSCEKCSQKTDICTNSFKKDVIKTVYFSCRKTKLERLLK